jgi:hypothetical protein
MLQLGRQGQLYTIAEVTQGTIPSLSATDALRHINFGINYDPVGRVPILEKTTGVGNNTTSRMDNRAKADYTYEGLFRPSGVLNTLPEQKVLLEAGFGAVNNTTLATTFSGTPTVSTGTVGSATGLAVGRWILITCPDGKRRLRQLTALSGTDLTWAPNLPAGQNPAAGAACKGVITYSLTSALIKTFAFAHYLKFTDGTAGLARAVAMAVADKLMIEVDANGSPMLKVSGPAKHQTTAAAQPGGFTTVGTVPPSGISGDLMIGNNALKFLKFGMEISNAMYLRNEEYGEASASEAFRGGRREVALSLDTYHENQASLYDLAMTGSYVPVFFQGGYTEGNCFAIRCPTSELKLPKLDDPDTPVKAPYTGVALESSGNDECTLALG